MRYRLFLNERLRGFRRWVDAMDSRRFGLAMLVVLGVGLTTVICSNYLPSRYAIEAGDVAPETITAPRTVTFENSDVTAELRTEAANLVEPAYRPNPTALSTATASVHSLFQNVRDLQEEIDPRLTTTTSVVPSATVTTVGEAGGTGASNGGGSATTTVTTVATATTTTTTATVATTQEAAASGTASSSTMVDGGATVSTAVPSTVATTDRWLEWEGPSLSWDQAVAEVRKSTPATVSDETLLYLLKADSEHLTRMEEEARGVLRIVYVEKVTEATLESEKGTLHSLADSLDMSPSDQETIYNITAAYLKPNHILDEEQTRVRREEAMRGVAPVMVTVLKGERIVQKGDVITPENMLALQNLGLVETRSNWKIWTGVFLVVLLELLALVLLLVRFRSATLRDNNLMLVVTTLLLLFAALSRLLTVPTLSPYLIPIAALGMLATIMVGTRVGLVLVAISSLNVGLITNFNFSFTLVGILVGAISLYLVSHLSQRSELLSAGGLIMLIGGGAVFSSELLRQAPLTQALQSSLWGVGNGFLSMVLTVGLLMVFEAAFNLTTPLRLLELTNPAQPLLRRLMQVAPGTYNHSILMGNLAEAAAEAIGADPLLARVGAYYHDIGKTQRPDYFIENQIHMKNPHDKLTPNLSKLAVKAHVRDGVNLAEEFGLPRPIRDIIRQHHGTSVLSYFYHKAKETSEEEVSRDGYRYEDEKPTSREAAIILLADSVEAAAKAMREPTAKKLQMLIRDIFKQKTEDGQLDRSELTFGDVQKIREVFENSLRGFLGSRIEYPDEDNEDETVLSRAAGADHPPHFSSVGPRLRSVSLAQGEVARIDAEEDVEKSDSSESAPSDQSSDQD